MIQLKHPTKAAGRPNSTSRPERCDVVGDNCAEVASPAPTTNHLGWCTTGARGADIFASVGDGKARRGELPAPDRANASCGSSIAAKRCWPAPGPNRPRWAASKWCPDMVCFVDRGRCRSGAGRGLTLQVRPLPRTSARTRLRRAYCQPANGVDMGVALLSFPELRNRACVAELCGDQQHQPGHLGRWTWGIIDLVGEATQCSQAGISINYSTDRRQDDTPASGGALKGKQSFVPATAGGRGTAEIRTGTVTPARRRRLRGTADRH